MITTWDKTVQAGPKALDPKQCIQQTLSLHLVDEVWLKPPARARIRKKRIIAGGGGICAPSVL